MKISQGEKTFKVVNNIILCLIGFSMLYPFWNLFVKSFSSNVAILTGNANFWFGDFNIEAYKKVIENPMFSRTFLNTLIITIFGTGLTVFVTVCTAFVFSQDKLYKKELLFNLFIFTMLFSGGIIPMFLLIKSLKLYNTLSALILPSAISVYFIIVTRNYMKQLPSSVMEAALMDGCNDISLLFKMVLPMSMPIIATISLFSAVNYWNTFMNGIIYIDDQSKYPLMVYVRLMVFEQSFLTTSDFLSSAENMEKSYGTETLKAAVVMITSIPIIVIYPFLQRYFVQGLSAGAVKE